MSKRKISKVTGLLGSVLINITSVALFIWHFAQIIGSSGEIPGSRGEELFQLESALALIAVAYIIPGGITLVISVFLSEEINADFAMKALLLILSGLLFTFISIISYGYFLENGAHLVLNVDHFAFGITTPIASLSILISGVLGMITASKEKARVPRNNGNTQLYQ